MNRDRGVRGIRVLIVHRRLPRVRSVVKPPE
jgi:hypothetical protein